MVPCLADVGRSPCDPGNLPPGDLAAPGTLALAGQRPLLPPQFRLEPRFIRHAGNLPIADSGLANTLVNTDGVAIVLLRGLLDRVADRGVPAVALSPDDGLDRLAIPGSSSARLSA